MSEQVKGWLREYGAQIAEKEAIELPLQAAAGQVRLLICSGGNIEEMMEEALDGNDSIRLYAEEQAEAAADLSVDEVRRNLVGAALAQTPQSAAADGPNRAGLNDLYRVYVAQWEDGIAMLDEAIPAAEDRGGPAGAALPDRAWIERNEEGELLLLDLSEAEAWKAPLIVPMGGFNDCPQPLEQAVLFRDWQRRFGAIPAAATQDTWLLRTERRPETDEEALDLAKEHFIFCQYVLESFETLGQYAGHLKRTDTWEFWWD